MKTNKLFFSIIFLTSLLVSIDVWSTPPPLKTYVDFETLTPSILRVETGFKTNQVSEQLYINEVLVVVLDVLGNERIAKVEINEKLDIIEGDDVGESLYPGFFYIIASNDFVYDNKKIIIKNKQ